MGKNLLTPKQRELLELISKDKTITSQFYLTGGTALSYFYFKHRFSEDLDFFSGEEFNSKTLLAAISKIGDISKPKKIEQQSLNQQEIFYFYFDKKNFVKLDFAYFPFETLGQFIKFNDLKVTSVEDIAINKLHAISTRKRSRDYFDLYLLMKRLNWDFKFLRKNYRLKFGVDLPLEQIATTFLKVQDAEDLPIFLGDQNFEEVKTFFLMQADKLKESILK